MRYFVILWMMMVACMIPLCSLGLDRKLDTDVDRRLKLGPQVSNNRYSVTVKSPYHKFDRPSDSLIFPENVTYIPEKKYFGGKYRNVIIPPSIEAIGRLAFSDNNELVNLNLGRVYEIGREAFKGCSRLERVIIPPETRIIKRDAFEGCPLFFLQLSSEKWNPVVHFKKTFGAFDIPFIMCPSECIGVFPERSYQSDMPDVFSGRVMIHLEKSPIPIYYSLGQRDSVETLWPDNLDLWAMTDSVNGQSHDTASLLYPVTIRIDNSCISGKSRERLRVYYNEDDMTDSVKDNILTITTGVVYDGGRMGDKRGASYNNLRIEADFPPAPKRFFSRAEKTSINASLINHESEGIRYRLDTNNRTADIIAVDKLISNELPKNVMVGEEIYHVTGIAPYCLWSPTVWSVDSISIPEGVKEIGEAAFVGFPHLRVIRLPFSLEKVGRGAFAYTALENLMFPERWRVVEESTFIGCGRLKDIELGRVHTIMDNAFKDTGIVNLVLPQSIGHLGRNSFSGCPLNYVEFNGSLTTEALILADFAAVFGSCDIPLIKMSMKLRDYPTLETDNIDILEKHAVIYYADVIRVPVKYKFGDDIERDWTGISKLYIMTDSVIDGDSIKRQFIKPLSIRISDYSDDIHDKIRIRYNRKDIKSLLHEGSFILTEGKMKKPQDIDNSKSGDNLLRIVNEAGQWGRHCL